MRHGYISLSKLDEMREKHEAEDGDADLNGDNGVVHDDGLLLRSGMMELPRLVKKKTHRNTVNSYQCRRSWGTGPEYCYTSGL